MALEISVSDHTARVAFGTVGTQYVMAGAHEEAMILTSWYTEKRRRRKEGGKDD